MANSKMLTALNDQVKHEFYSSYLYLSMSAYYSSIGLSGFAHWMRLQAEEEMLHTNKFYDYILARGGNITLQAIEAPPATWKTPLAAFEAGLAHEKEVTKRINDLMDLALKEKDHAAHMFLQWFINEQVEEEDSFSAIINSLKLINGEGHGLLQIDRELAQRATTQADTAQGA